MKKSKEFLLIIVVGVVCLYLLKDAGGGLAVIRLLLEFFLLLFFLVGIVILVGGASRRKHRQIKDAQTSSVGDVQVKNQESTSILPLAVGVLVTIIILFVVGIFFILSAASV